MAAIPTRSRRRHQRGPSEETGDATGMSAEEAAAAEQWIQDRIAAIEAAGGSDPDAEPPPPPARPDEETGDATGMSAEEAAPPTRTARSADSSEGHRDRAPLARPPPAWRGGSA